MTRNIAIALALAGILQTAGCVPPDRRRVNPPALSPAEAAKQAMTNYDTNKDGFLDAAELEKSPPLKAALERIDANKDGKLSAEEIESRLRTYRDNNIGMMATTARIFLDTVPLEGAKVTLVPEPFLGSAFKRATGVTNDNGYVAFQTDGESVEGVACGLYRLEVSKNDGGKEIIPARYNVQTTLGFELAQDKRQGLVFYLTSR
jgi:hypothetical protein